MPCPPCRLLALFAHPLASRPAIEGVARRRIGDCARIGQGSTLEVEGAGPRVAQRCAEQTRVLAASQPAAAHAPPRRRSMSTQHAPRGERRRPRSCRTRHGRRVRHPTLTSCARSKDHSRPCAGARGDRAGAARACTAAQVGSRLAARAETALQLVAPARCGPHRAGSAAAQGHRRARRRRHAVVNAWRAGVPEPAPPTNASARHGGGAPRIVATKCATAAPRRARGDRRSSSASAPSTPAARLCQRAPLARARVGRRGGHRPAPSRPLGAARRARSSGARRRRARSGPPPPQAAQRRAPTH